MLYLVEYIPIVTTILAVVFFIQIRAHYLKKPQATYLLWWTIGVFTYGLGTFAESIHAIGGWNMVLTKVWYIAGALLGGFPLAQGTVYLLMKKKTADLLTIVFLTIIVVAAFFVGLTPTHLPEDFDGRLSGSVFAWEWVRYFSPFINIYAFIFLVGGAFYSAWKYAKIGKAHTRFLGNVYIAIGALLPGIGGSFTRFGHVEVLYITELAGLILIYAGYRIMRTDKEVSVHRVQEVRE